MLHRQAKSGGHPWIGVILALGFGLVSCHQCGHDDDIGWDGALVGGACDSDSHCHERCQRGRGFPHGTCTVDCRDDGDCPGGAVCVDRAGGICLLACEFDSDCRDDYECHDVDREGVGGSIEACID